MKKKRTHEIGFRSDDNSLFSSKNWLEVLSKTYGYKIHYFVTSGPAQTVIPYTVVNNLKGSQVISFPFCDYIETEDIEKNEYIRFVESLKRQYPNYPILLKTTYDESAPLGKIVRQAVVHIIDLTKEVKYGSTFKRGIKKAVNQGIYIAQNNTEEGLELFYKLYTKLRLTKFKSLPQPFTFFKNIFDVFISKGMGNIFTAIYEKEVIAAVVVLKYKNVLYYKFGASALNKLEYRPNNLLFDHLINYAKEEGYDMLNLGLSGKSENYSGLRRFKENMGGKPKDITYFRSDPEDYNATKENEVLQFLRQLTKNVVKTGQEDTELINSFAELLYPNFA